MSVLVNGWKMPEQCYDCYLVAMDPDVEQLYCKHLDQYIENWNA